MTKKIEPNKKLLLEIEELKLRLAEAEDTLRAFREGKEDASNSASPIYDVAGNGNRCAGASQEITDLKQAETALRESELFYRQMLESIPGMVFTTRPDGYCDYQSQQWVDFTGVPMSEHMGDGWNRLLHPEDRPRAFAAWRAAVEERAPYDLEYRVRRHDGAYEWFKVRGRPIRNAAGEIVRWFGTLLNIDHLLKTQEALRASEEHVRLKLNSILLPAGDIGNLEFADIIDAPAIQALVDNLYTLVHLPVGILDLKGNVLVGAGWQDICKKFHRVHPESCGYCLESDLELTRGVPAGEFRLYKCKNGMWDVVTPVMVGGQHMGNLFCGQFFFEDEPLDREFFRAQALRYGFNEEEYLAALERVPQISREALDTGMDFYLKLAEMLSRLSYSNIKLARLLSERDTLLHSLRDSEEGLKHSVEEAEQAKEFYRVMGETLPYGVWMCGPDGSAQYASQSFLDLLEMTMEEMKQFGWARRLPSEDVKPMLKKWRLCVKTGKPWDHVHRIYGPEQKPHYVLTRGLPVRDKDGKITTWVGINLDIDERKQAEESVLKLSGQITVRNAELEDANRELESFIYSVSHDLRAPLRSIASFITLLGKDYADRFDERAKNYLARIINGSAKMNRLIEDMLHLSKISKQEVSRDVVDISSLANSVISDLREAYPGRMVEFVVKEDVTASADPGLMEMVFVNLLGNAWKFTGKVENARIEAGAGKQNGQTVYYIKDNGSGFDQEYAGQMFLPFHRLHSENEFEGTGIGLAIVERIIHRHGGRIWAEGEPGKGATVFFALGVGS